MQLHTVSDSDQAQDHCVNLHLSLHLMQVHVFLIAKLSFLDNVWEIFLLHDCEAMI